MLLSILAIGALLVWAVFGVLVYDSNAVPSTPVKIPSGSTLTGSPSRATVANSYVVKLKVTEQNTILPRDYNSHEKFHKRASQSIEYETRREFADESIFLGLSLTLLGNNDDSLAKLRSLDEVEQVWPVRSIPRPMAHLAGRATGFQERAWNLFGKADFQVKPRAFNVALPHIVGKLKTASALQMSNVDKIHAKGIKGKGIKIAVIDTGIDYRHPSLGGCFGPGCKISFGYNFVGDNYPSQTTTSPDPLTTCADGGHGTHVMGTIGMEDSQGTGFGLMGVAPEAELGMYRVFGCSGMADSDVVIAAMLQAAADGANVISMSLGELSPSSKDNPYSVITDRLSAKKIAVISAAGNDGHVGVYSPSYPGTGSTVLAIGSVDNTEFPVTYQASDSNGRHFRYASVFPVSAPPGGLSLILLGAPEMTIAQMCEVNSYIQAAAKLVNASTTILAIMTSGICTSTMKAQIAATYGFKYVMFYYTDNNITMYKNYFALEPSDHSNLTSFVVITNNAGSIMNDVAKNPNYKLFFGISDYAAQSTSQLTGGFMSNFSSFGPTTELDMKPQISAPGGNILSTWPLSAGGYAILSGTSMATPFMAGCYALVKSQRRDLSVMETFALLMNTASPLPWQYDQSILSSSAHQGAGLVNPKAALDYQSLVMPQQLNLGSGGSPFRSSITIKNRSSRTKTYVLSHRPAGLMQLEYDQELVNQMYPQYATVSFSSNTLSIQGGEIATVDVMITPPTANPDGKPVYSGYIVVTNNNDIFNVPYIGQPYDVSFVNLIADIVPYPLKTAVNGSNVQLLDAPCIVSGSQVLTAPDFGLQNFSMFGQNYPGIIYGTTQISDYIRFDVVAANTSFVPTKYGFDPSVKFDDLVYPDLPTTTIVGLETVGTAIDYGYGPFDRMPVASFEWLDASLPPADYRLVLRVLRSGGNYDDPKDWNSWLSAIVRIG